MHTSEGILFFFFMTMLGSVLEILIKHLGGVLRDYSLDFKKEKNREKKKKKKGTHWQLKLQIQFSQPAKSLGVYLNLPHLSFTLFFFKGGSQPSRVALESGLNSPFCFLWVPIQTDMRPKWAFSCLCPWLHKAVNFLSVPSSKVPGCHSFDAPLLRLWR